MRRMNTASDALNTGTARVDTGQGVYADIPLIPSAGGGGTEIQDTGMRDISASTNGLTAGKVYLRRYGDVVRFNAYGATFTATNVNLYTLPVGFRPDYHTMLMQHIHANQTGHSRVIVSSTSGAVQPYGGTDGLTVYISLMWLTRDAFPTTMPGVAG